MENEISEIDIKENYLQKRGDLLNILLIDKSTNRNIIWAIDSYINQGNKDFSPKSQIKAESVTGENNKLIQPRASKSIEEQKKRTKEKAEVFTDLSIVKQINLAIDAYKISKNNWQDYVKEIKLEITCGEAPFIASRYDPTANGKLIPIKKRVGFLDKKLKTVNCYCQNEEEWLFWAKEAYKACYGYEWQGDNLLIARENLLYTFIDYYEFKFNKKPSLKLQKEIAEIICWNIFQMDGLKYVIPMSCRHEINVTEEVLNMFNEVHTPEKIEKNECEGCKYNRVGKHNGKYVKIMDWEQKKQIRFADLNSI
jgi:hypothetical protein